MHSKNGGYYFVRFLATFGRVFMDFWSFNLVETIILWIWDSALQGMACVNQESHHWLWTSHILVPWAAWESPSLRLFVGVHWWKTDFYVLLTLVEVGIMKFTLFCESRSLRINLDVFGALRGKVLVCDSKVTLVAKNELILASKLCQALWCFWILDLFNMIFYFVHFVNHHQTTIWMSSFSFFKHLFCKFKESLCFGVSKWNGWIASSSRNVEKNRQLSITKPSQRGPIL